MASELRVNTLKDASGNNSIATSFVAGGSAKVWFHGTDNVATDSLNVSGTTDNGAGDYTITFSNAMANATYALATCILEDFNMVCISKSQATSNYRVQVENTSNAAGDSNNSSMLMGDLA